MNDYDLVQKVDMNDLFINFIKEENFLIKINNDKSIIYKKDKEIKKLKKNLSIPIKFTISKAQNLNEDQINFLKNFKDKTRKK